MTYRQVVPKYNLGGNINSLEGLYTGGYPVKKKFENGGSIHIKPSKKGTFTTAAKKRGLGVQEFASKVLSNKEDYSSAMVKKANFARNASKWNHAYGGEIPQYNAGGVLSGAASGASLGSIAGPWGTVIGAVGGALAGLIGGNNKRREQRQAQEDAYRLNRNRQEEIYRMNDQSVLSQYEFYGNPYESYYAQGGTIDLKEGADYEVEGNEVIQGQAILEDSNQIATDLQIAEGPSHEAGGVLGIGGERVFSDRKKVDSNITELLSELGIGQIKGKTYADIAKSIGNKKGKMEAKLLSPFTPANKTAEKTLPRIDAALDILFESQEAGKEEQEETVFAKGGKIKPYRRIDSYPDGGWLNVLGGTYLYPQRNRTYNRITLDDRFPGIPAEARGKGLNTDTPWLPRGYWNNLPQPPASTSQNVTPVEPSLVNLNPFQYRNPFQYNIDFDNAEPWVEPTVSEDIVRDGNTPSSSSGSSRRAASTAPSIATPTTSSRAANPVPQITPVEYAGINPNVELSSGQVTPTALTPNTSNNGNNSLPTVRAGNFDWGNLIGQVGNLGSYLSNRQDIANLDTSVQRTLMPAPNYNYIDRSQPERREVGRMVRTGQRALQSSSRTVNAANQAAIIAQGLNANNQITQQENRNRDRYNQYYDDRVWRTAATNIGITNQAADQRRELENNKNVRLPQQARTAFLQGVMGNEAVRQQRASDRDRLKISALLNDNNGVLTRAAEKLGYTSVDEYINALLNR